MSHEIRTPLNAVLGFSDLLKDETLTAQVREQYGATITRNGRLLTRIIDDILDLTKPIDKSALLESLTTFRH